MAKQTQIAVVKDRNNLKMMLASEKFTSMAKQVASQYMSIEKMTKIAILAATRQPKLLRCTVESVLDSIIKAGELGLDFGGQSGQGYLIPYGSKYLPKGTYECKFLPGYQGFIEIAYRTEKVAFLDAEVVYSEDYYDYALGSKPFIEHKPCLTGDRGEPLFAYCVVIRKDSDFPKIEIMSRQQIEAVQASSRSGDEGPWATFPDEMWRKTVVRRAWKYMPKTTEINQAAELDNQDYSFEDAADVADAEIDNTMGSKQVDAKEVTNEPENPVAKTWRCTNDKCKVTVNEEPKEKNGKLQCPKCLRLTMVPVGDEDFMED